MMRFTLIRGSVVLALFVIFMAMGLPIAFAEELTVETVGRIWPYPQKILKVVAAGADISVDGQKLRMVDVMTKSSSTGKCMAYQTYFKQNSGVWAFESVANEFQISCKSLKAKEGVSTGSVSGSSSDPRDTVEEGLSETDRTLNDVEEVIDTGKRIKQIKDLF